MKKVALLAFHREALSNVQFKPSCLDLSDVGWKTRSNVIFALIQKSFITIS